MTGTTEGLNHSSAAVRSRRYRQRRRKSRIVVTIEVDLVKSFALVRYGLIDGSEMKDRKAIAHAIELLLEGLSKNGVAFTIEWIETLPCASRVAARLAERSITPNR